MRIVSKEQISALGLTLADALAGLRESFPAAGAGEIVWRPKSTINQADGAFLTGTLACWPAKNVGLFHCIMGISAVDAEVGMPHYTTLQILSDYRTGHPIVAIDGTFTSTILPAGVTALAAERLAKPDAHVAAFVGTGVQAKVNLEAIRGVRDIRKIKVLDRGRTSTKAFAKHGTSLGLAVELIDNPEAMIRDSDIIITSVPSSPDLVPFLDPGWVSPGAFVSAVDVGRSWRPGFEKFERRVTDDRPQAEIQHREGRMNYGGPFDHELVDIMGRNLEQGNGSARSVFIHPGNVVGVLGITLAIWKKLRES